jgi:hypothetical protein
MGSQKVPGMVVLHCTGRAYDRAYVITFRAGPLRIHTLTPSIPPMLEDSEEGFFRNLPEFGRRIRSDPPGLQNAPPCGPFAEYRTAKSHSERDPESAVEEEFTKGDVCGSAHHRDAETAPLSLSLGALRPPNCIAQPL